MMTQLCVSRRPPRRRRLVLRARAAFTLVEILTALTMLAFAMSGLGQIMVVLDQRNAVLDLRSKRNFALMQQQTKFITMNYDTLTSDSATFRVQKTLWAGDLQYNRRVSITSIGNDQYSIKVVIVPTGLHGSHYNYSDTLQKDSVLFDRAKPFRDALCTGC